MNRTTVSGSRLLAFWTFVASVVVFTVSVGLIIAVYVRLPQAQDNLDQAALHASSLLPHDPHPGVHDHAGGSVVDTTTIVLSAPTNGFINTTYMTLAGGLHPWIVNIIATGKRAIGNEPTETPGALLAAILFENMASASFIKPQTAAALLTTSDGEPTIFRLDIGVASDDQRIPSTAVGQRKRSGNNHDDDDDDQGWWGACGSEHYDDGDDDDDDDDGDGGCKRVDLGNCGDRAYKCSWYADDDPRPSSGITVVKYWPAGVNYRSSLVGINRRCPKCALHVHKSTCIDGGVRVSGQVTACNSTNLCGTLTNLTNLFSTGCGRCGGGSSLPGPAGPPGPRGINGTRGAAGLVGPAGPRGLNGTNGAPGPVGPAGPRGLNGTAGPVGPAGPRGLNGTIGAPGPQGVAGLNGTAGGIGPVGPLGPAGPQGPAGHDGVDGTTGPVGEQGPIGSQGPPGPQGPSGANATMGLRGPAGVQGPAGLDGYDGQDGLDGSPGVNGLDGPVGPAGPAGQPGPNGDRVPQLGRRRRSLFEPSLQAPVAFAHTAAAEAAARVSVLLRSVLLSAGPSRLYRVHRV